MRERGLPLTARLAITYALLVGATLLVVIALTLQLTRTHLSTSLDRRLLAAVESFESGPARRVQRPEDLEVQARRWLQASVFPGDQTVWVRTADGTTLASAGGLDLGAIPGADPLLDVAEPSWADLEAPDAPVRALAVPLVLDGRRAGTLLVASSRASDRATLGALLSGVAIAGGLGLAFATALGVVSVRRTLRPLRRMADEVSAIEATGDLTRRVGHGGPPDEVGRLAESFDRMVARLQEAFTSQRRFLSDASHELRTPLTVARGQLELLEEALRSPEARRSLAVTMEELDRMRRIVDDLLLLARLDEGVPLRREPVEVELVLREALLRGMQLAAVTARVEAEPGAYAVADPDRLLQVLTNLVTNAVRHAGPDATITLRSRAEGGRVRLEVSDDGPGIPPEELPHVFDRMFRGARARTDTAGGAGLGLAIAASLTEAMGGSISVASEPGRGATFTIDLPEARGAEILTEAMGPG
ncbi:MAG TPA: HAMP domain-containing sensor histidine kinase [Actinomycetota bacterium]|nr:HAMP domain-containing sensor histidine kinase [Actinomycetota bacterium]